MHVDSTVPVALAVVLISVVTHEYGHALAALGLGDSQGSERERLKTHPLRCVDLLGSLVVPAALVVMASPILFAWGRPIRLDRSRLRDLRNGPALVALAGPSANALLAVASAACARWASDLGLALLTRACFLGVAWNCALALFHLIPIPPLDGSWVLMRFLRLRHIVALHHFRLAGAGLVLALAVAPVSSRLLFRGPHGLAVEACLSLFGLTPAGAAR